MGRNEQTVSIEQIQQSVATAPADRAEQEKRLRHVCQEFESLFIAHLLKTMRECSAEEGLFGEGLGGDVYQSLFEAEVARKIAQTKGLGIADILYRNLVQQTGQQVPPVQKEPAPSQSVPGRISRYDAFIREACEQYSVPVHVVYAVIEQESAGNPHAVSAKKAKGLMQLMDHTARELGVRNVFDVRENIAAGVRYLRQMLDRFGGDLKRALAAYNAGPGAVERHNGVPPYAETQRFVERVLAAAEQYGSRLTTTNSSGTEVREDGV
ncbi:MAG: transglycosylase SLT domain-containing protein [candidate division KSB1 bacterium]|nr:transglycosylase SLT domain-containing protein [candidate division KSB1 bacterium]